MKHGRDNGRPYRLQLDHNLLRLSVLCTHIRRVSLLKQASMGRMPTLESPTLQKYSKGKAGP